MPTCEPTATPNAARGSNRPSYTPTPTRLSILLLFLAALPAWGGQVCWRGSGERVGRAVDLEFGASGEEKSAEAAAELLVGPDSEGSRRHVVVQFDRGLTAADRAAVSLAGLQLLSPLGDNSFFAVVEPGRVDLAALTRAVPLRHAQAVQRAWKLHPGFTGKELPRRAIVTTAESDREDTPPTVAAYLLFHQDIPLIPDGENIAKRHGATVRSYLRAVNGLVIELPADRITPLADEDAVQWIEPPLPAFGEANDSNRWLTQAETVQTHPDYELDGTGVTVLLYDGGVADGTHPDFGGRLTARDGSDEDSHPTHVAGTIGGSGLASNGVYRGMAPGVIIESYGFETQYHEENPPLYADPGDLENDYSDAIANFGVDVANNSIGTNTCTNGFDCAITGDYGITAQLIDAIVTGTLGNPLTVVWSNGNERNCSRCRTEGVHTPEGYHSTAPPSCAKNHITVGAVNANDDFTTIFSSWGPTDDGRIKPDVTAPGCEIGDDFGVTSCVIGGGYMSACGTSMSAPTVTGLIALLLEDYRTLLPAAADPRNATIKAILTHNAADLGNRGPDYQNGYGSVRIRDSIDFLRTEQFREGQLDQGERYPLLVQVDPGDGELKITLAWDDYPAAPNVTRALVNDLDLRVFDPQGNRHYPWTLDPADPAAPATRVRADHLNNIEQVLVDDPAAGLWLVEVFGYGVPAGPQSFSLCVSPQIPTDCDGNGQADDAEITANPDLDCSGNGLLDVCEIDCDGNGIPDSCDIEAGLADDCNGNDLVDACEPDCNGNGIPDDCDVIDLLVADCNHNGVPDDCEPDCNSNNVADSCDIESGTVADCNADGVPDICQDTSADCNDNGEWDACETAEGLTEDFNHNSVPDVCEDRERILYVDANCSGPGTGTIEDPFCAIQPAINAAISGNRVIVAEGVYQGRHNRDLDFGGRLITLQSTDPANAAVVAGTVIDPQGAGRGFFFHSHETRSAVLDGLTIRNGTAAVGSTFGSYRGGAIYCVDSNPTIRRCVLQDNSIAPTILVEYGGGGIYCERSSPAIDRCTITGNETTNSGGGVYCFDNSPADITDSVISGNQSFLGGGIACYLSNALIRNCTIVDNLADGYRGGALHCNDAIPTVTSSILWGNLGETGPDQIFGEPTVSYSDVEGGWVGTGNLDADPAFIAGGDYHLTDNSPCIDAGDPAFFSATATDLDGEPRVQHCRVDLGASESPFFADCNSNESPDACEILDGSAEDTNGNGVVDVCEFCDSQAECDDGWFCNGVEECIDNLCLAGTNPCPGRVCDELTNRCIECRSPEDCDDGNPCTDHQCDHGLCRNVLIANCAPVFSLMAAAVNGIPLPDGPASEIEVRAGDTVTTELYLRNWGQRKLDMYEVSIDSAGFDSGPRGSLAPQTDPTPSSGAFINQQKEDFAFFGLATVTAVSTEPPDYTYGAVPMYASVLEPDYPVYCGTLVLNVSDDALGDFTVDLVPGGDGKPQLHLDPEGFVDHFILEPLTIHVPIPGCTRGTDCDENGIADTCDIAVGLAKDCNGNGVPDACDLAFAADCNHNGIPDDCEPDCNENGIADECDLAAGISADCDENGVPDECEDCNGNGFADICDLTAGISYDCNVNLIPDECDVVSGVSVDCNSNEIPDECDVAGWGSSDCNENGIPDECDLVTGAANDCDNNGIADDCEDCNGNGWADECDVADDAPGPPGPGISDDCNANGLPDECEDCNTNGIADECDITEGNSGDCNGNWIPDECEDCNGNGFADECDVNAGTSADLNGDGVPDECDPCADLNCDDGLFCNGQETCSGGTCVEGTAPCIEMRCDEQLDECVECLTDSDCADGNSCTVNTCENGVCQYALRSGSCDDDNRCTADDECANGGCAGLPIPGCGAAISLRAAAVNSTALPQGPVDRVIVEPGDTVNCEIHLEGWTPDALRSYRATVDAAGFTSAAIGVLTPSTTPHATAGAYIDRYRAAYPFRHSPSIATVLRGRPDYEYSAIGIHQSVVEAEIPSYGGTLILEVSQDAAGAFVVGFDCSDGQTVLLDDNAEPIGSLQLHPLIISVPPPGCTGGPDCNENGIRDDCDLSLGQSPDCNGNNIPDDCDVAKGGASEDCTHNGVPDECEPDCNHNGIADSCDIAAAAGRDCNDNGIPDECEDCDDNGLADECEIADGIAPDCNDNGVPDKCDIAAGTSLDCTGNGTPDECESDCNGNGVADSCDIAGATSVDLEDNGVPDECQAVRHVPADFTTIQQAIDAALPGDVVEMADGVYTRFGNVALDFAGKNLTVRSANGPAACIIDGGGSQPAFVFQNGEGLESQIYGFTITNSRGIECDNSGPTIRNCIITGNHSAGITCRNGSSPRIVGCLITGNQGVAGGGISSSYSDPVIRHCTIVGNTASFCGGALHATAGRPVVSMCILWRNTALTGTEIDLRSNSAMAITYSDIQGGTAGAGLIHSAFSQTTGNLAIDPGFTDADHGDFRLVESSRCINAGDPAFSPLPGETDLAGASRVLFGAADLGAYEADVFGDCNHNAVPDWLDITGVTSNDCNGNRVPDECDPYARIIVGSDPPTGAIDARQPFDPAGGASCGWQIVNLVFDGSATGLTAADFSIATTGESGPAPQIRSVTVVDDEHVEVVLRRPLDPGTRTTISYTCNGSRIALGYLPGDVDGDGTTDMSDLQALIDSVTGTTDLPLWSTDLNRSGTATASDILREIDLLNGAGQLDPWLGELLP